MFIHLESEGWGWEHGHRTEGCKHWAFPGTQACLSSVLLCSAYSATKNHLPLLSTISIPFLQYISTHIFTHTVPSASSFLGSIWVLHSPKSTGKINCALLWDALTLFYMSLVESLSRVSWLLKSVFSTEDSFSRAGPVSHESLHPNHSVGVAACVSIHEERLAVGEYGQQLEKWEKFVF